MQEASSITPHKGPSSVGIDATVAYSKREI